MNDIEHFESSPFNIKISFHKVLENLEEIAASDIDYRSDYAKALLRHTEPFPELREGITDPKELDKHKVLIQNLLADLFPTALTKNEIKAATIPFYNITFNYTERLRSIMDNAGTDFDMSIRDFNDHEFYIMGCCLILNSYYGYHFDFNRPLFYDIPDAEGIMKHYRILYNADFVEILPTEKSVKITKEDVKLLMDNFSNLELWKEKFPEKSWTLKGFGIVSFFDATIESAISNLKSNLLKADDLDKDNMKGNQQDIFRSIYKIPDLKIGFTEANIEDNIFKVAPFDGIESYILKDGTEINCSAVFCGNSLKKIIEDHSYFVISDVENYICNNNGDIGFAEHLLSQGIKSCILAPLIKNDTLMGIIELVSSRPGELNSINANKLAYILPFLTDKIDSYYSELQNQVDAIIQKEYTAIHHSVYWKFREEALRHINNGNDKNSTYKEIVFKEIYPLYGQIDVKGSSTARNESTEQDLVKQIERLLSLFRYIFKIEKLPLMEQHIYELENMEDKIKDGLQADSEAIIQNYIKLEVHPLLEHFDSVKPEIHQHIDNYFKTLDGKVKMVYDSRKNFDEALSIINKHLAEVLDKKQIEAQKFYPHYYERFKTDGVEHNLYIGASIAPKQPYNPLYLENLRLWQLQAMCEMENEYYKLNPILPYQLDVTSLILVFSSPISIRFRMDEKRFDVDGTYNARYEVVKKRIDKSNIKGTNERITEKGKITIVYSQKQEEIEYRRYIKFLQHRNLVDTAIEQFEVEDLQGVTGLKALRISLIYSLEKTSETTYSYDDLLKELADVEINK
ncbi:GAF domain-containing protein [Flavobacterium arcticum]|uniref:GAF domain-containing protein n=1 Tax=Flavobacterium arcticum TaxID=1784713 RepID=A0A345H8I7_9FLAO|nr:GAF domain-containing protein [Flavobacterium arcticum]AXG72897.1 GAF domain-containing protein [Flavobacterium arcticum]KAF2510438.1 GAF domain-containing protein [Flavobacterium arcticum]